MLRVPNQIYQVHAHVTLLAIRKDNILEYVLVATINAILVIVEVIMKNRHVDVKIQAIVRLLLHQVLVLAMVSAILKGLHVHVMEFVIKSLGHVHVIQFVMDFKGVQHATDVMLINRAPVMLLVLQRIVINATEQNIFNRGKG